MNARGGASLVFIIVLTFISLKDVKDDVSRYRVFEAVQTVQRTASWLRAKAIEQLPLINLSDVDNSTNAAQEWALKQQTDRNRNTTVVDVISVSSLDTIERVQEQKRSWANHHEVRNVFMAFETTTDISLGPNGSCAILTSNCGVNEDATKDCMDRRFALGLSSSARRYRKLVHAMTLGVRGAHEEENEWTNHYGDVLPDYLFLTYDSNSRGYNISRLAECEGLHGHSHVPVVYTPDDQGIIFSKEAVERLLRLVSCLPRTYRDQTHDHFEDVLCDFVARLMRDEANPYSVHDDLLSLTLSNSQSYRQVSVIDMLNQYVSTLHILCKNNAYSKIPSSKEMLGHLLKELQLGVQPHETCL